MRNRSWDRVRGRGQEYMERIYLLNVGDYRDPGVSSLGKGGVRSWRKKEFVDTGEEESEEKERIRRY